MATVVAASPSTGLFMSLFFPFAPGGFSAIETIVPGSGPNTAVVTGTQLSGVFVVEVTYFGSSPLESFGTIPTGGSFTAMALKSIFNLVETDIGSISGITRPSNFGEIDTVNAQLILFGDGGNDTVDARGGDDSIAIAPVAGAPLHDIDGGTGTDAIVAVRNQFSTQTTLDLRNSALKSIEAIGFGDGLSTSFSGSIILNSSQLAAGKVSLSSEVGGTGTFHVMMNQVGSLDLSSLRVSDTISVVVDGTTGSDTIVGTNVADILQPGAGKDTVSGGDGNDVFRLKLVEAEFESINGGAGTDTVEATDTLVVLNGFNAAASSIETWRGGIVGTAGDNLFDFRGLTSQATSEFGTPFLELLGLAGKDSLIGSRFNDVISAGDDDDVLSGDAGADLLTGDAGRDRLTGGAGLDRFAFADVSESRVKKALRDTITDFETGVDTINLESIDADVNNPNDQAFKFVKKEGGAFKKKAGSVTFDQIDKKGASKDVTVVYADINGDKKADMAIHLTGLIDLEKSDFVL
jgi:Ca2+-binding RTX toxin-like protein